MDHIVYCDKKAGELSRLLAGEQTMVIRGAAGRKLPYGRISVGESLYFLENDGSGRIVAKGVVSDVFYSEKMTPEESERLIAENMERLKLTDPQKKRWSGKRYLCLAGVAKVSQIQPFTYTREKNMDDWIIVENIEDIKETI